MSSVIGRSLVDGSVVFSSNVVDASVIGQSAAAKKFTIGSSAVDRLQVGAIRSSFIKGIGIRWYS